MSEKFIDDKAIKAIAQAITAPIKAWTGDVQNDLENTITTMKNIRHENGQIIYFGNVYDILVKYCSASDDFRSRDAFVRAACKAVTDTEILEYNFGGSLGCGGKIWVNTGSCPYVTCYREDRNNARCKSILATNEAIKQLRH